MIPEETAGPYPGDGSNTNGGGLANALALSGIVATTSARASRAPPASPRACRSIVKPAASTPNNSCADLSGYAIYLWHCDREGRYSMYSSGVTAENYLRGVQATDAAARSRSRRSSPAATRAAGPTSTSRCTASSVDGHELGQQAAHVAARVPGRGVRRRLRHQRLLGERLELLAHHLRHRQRVQRRRRRCRWPRCPAAWTRATSRR